MKIIVKPHDIEIQKTEKVNENEYKITKCEFEFSEEYTDDLVKVALFTNSAGTYKQIIFNNECDIPPEILKVQEASILGVYAYKEENEELVLRYSPEPIKFYISKGSYIENAENSEPITPTDKEQIEQAIANLEVDKQDKLISGENIKTINGESLLGEGDIEIDQDFVKDDNYVHTDNNYTTDEKSKLASLENYDDTEVKADIEDLETNKADKSEIPDVSNFVTKSVNDLLNYYLKSDTYTKTEVNNLIGSIQQLHFEIVEELPSTGESNIIYLVPRSDSEESNVYDEYIYANNEWEKIGSTDIDLSNYVTTSDLNTALSNYTTTTDLNTLLSGKQNTIDSSHKLSSDLVDDTNNTNKFVTSAEKTTWNSKVSQEELNQSQAVQDNEISYLESITEQLPKTSGNGTDISLNDTIEAKMSVEVKGNTEQTTYTGKNLYKPFNFTKVNSGITFTYSEDGSLKGDGTASSTALSMFSSEATNYLITLSAGTYTISGANNKTILEVINSSGTALATTENTSLGAKTFTIDSETQVFIRAKVWTDTVLNNEKIYPQLELGSATSYEPFVGGKPSPSPDYPQNIRVVTGNNTIKIGGKNLFDKNNITNGRLDTNGNVAIIDEYFTSPFIKVEPNTQYTKNSPTADAYHRFAFYTNNDGTGFLSVSNSNTITTPSGCKYLRFCGLDTEIDTSQLEKNTTTTSYQPYQSQTYPLNLGNIEFCGIEDYRDYPYHDKVADKWYKYSVIGKVIFDGSNDENWNRDSVYTNTTLFNIQFENVSLTVSGDNTSMKAVSNYFTKNNPNILKNGNIVGVSTMRGIFSGIYISIENSIASTTEEFKSWLSTHNTTVYYILETPTITEITDATLIAQLNAIEEAMSYAGQTNITSTHENGNAPLFINAEAFSDIEKELDNKVDDVQVNGTSIVNGGVANIPVASANNLGVVKTYANLGTSMVSNAVVIEGATHDVIKNPSLYSSWRRPILPPQQHEATFYGLATASGDTTQASSSNAVGNYTPEAKTKIMNMLGDKYELISTDVLTEDITTFTKDIGNYESVMVVIFSASVLTSTTYITARFNLQNDSTEYTAFNGVTTSTSLRVGVEFIRKASDLIETSYKRSATSDMQQFNNVTSGAITKVKLLVTGTGSVIPSGSTIKVYGKGKI